MPPIIQLKETKSTNLYLKNLLIHQDDIEEGTIVSAQLQSAGRGQQGTYWEAEDGKNLTFSIVLYPTMINIHEQFIISQLVSLAIKDCLSEYTDNVTIKWPNDIYWRNNKICGMLIENNLIDNKIGQSVIGIGLNINQDKFISDAPNPTSLKKITGKEYNLDKILTDISERILLYYANVKKQDKTNIIRLYKESLFRGDGYHLYHDGVIDFLAKIQDVEPSGTLVLETMEQEIRKFAFKEVKYII